MEAARGENGGFATRANISISSSSSAQVQFPRSRGGHMHMPSDPSQMARQKVKFMCSSAGKILPRPSDLKLRYVGGETRMISVPRYINFTDFLAKMVEIYGPDIVMKYQLPEEDLDALVTVSTDEDLENMLEECDRLNSVGGSSKIRVFVFHASELDNDLQDLTDIQSSGQKFVDAINSASTDMPCGNYHSYKPAFTNANINALSDGYDTWNNVQTEDRGPALAEHFQSKVHPLENHVPAENLLNHIPDGQTQENFIQKSTLMDHPSSTLDNTNETDFYDLERDASGGSFLLTGHGIKQNYFENPWASSSPAEAYKGKRLVLQCGNEDEATSNENTGHEYIDIQNQFERFEPYNEYSDSVSQLHGNCFPMSPGTLLQKQLQSNQHQAEINRDDLIFMDNIQHYPKVRDFGQQPIHEHQEMKGHQYQWDNLPVYDSSGPLDNKHMDSNVSNLQASQRGIYTGTPPLASPRNKLTGETTDADLYHVSSAETSNLVPGDVPRASCNTPEIKKGRSEYESYVLDFSLQERFQDNNGHLNIYPPLETDGAAQEESQNQLNYQGWTVHSSPTSDICTLRSDKNYLQEGTDDQEIGWSTQDSESFSDRFSNIVSSNTMNNQAFVPHSDSDTIFLPFIDRIQSQALPFAERNLQGDGNEALMQEMKSPSFIDNFPTLDMITDLLQSSQLVDCLPADSSSAQSIGSRSAYSLEEECSGHKGEVTTTQDLPGTQRNMRDQNWNSIRDALPSKEEFDTSVFTSVFNREFQENNRLRMPDTKNITDTTESHSVKAPALSSLIDSWEPSLLQDGHNYHAERQYGHHQDQMIDLMPNPNTDALPEDSKFEFGEVEEFKSFDSAPIDPVAAAEREAQNRGLQIIRNADLEELRELGSGTFGTVYHGKWRGTDVAIKRIKASCFAGRDTERNRLLDDFWREACILGKLHHPNVVAFYGVVPDGPGGTLATVTEYMVNGSLKQVLQNKDRTLDRRKRLLIAMDAAFGMEYLHAKNVVHFDIKCENLLVNMRDPQRPICKVGDLGLSKVKQQTFVSGGVRGTLPWMAPELLSGGTGLVSEKVDVFSFGIVLWELLTGEEPYANMHYGAIIGGIVSNTLRPTVPRWCDPEWKTLMERCWAADPAERPTFYEIAGTLRAMEASLNAKAQGTAGLY